jgi:hypothetical protein
LRNGDGDAAQTRRIPAFFSFADLRTFGFFLLFVKNAE